MNINEATEILHNRGFMLEAKGAKTLNKAAKAADDEFYTYYKDVEKEMKNYNFSGKTVYCCCDNPEWSNVYKYFEDNFDKLGLKGLISSHYILPGDNETYWTEFKDGERIKHPLAGNGDCTSAECQKLADMADIIVTNPPFSLFADLFSLLVKHDKHYLLIGNQNALTYKEIFPLIQNNEAWTGYQFGDMKFRVPASSEPRETRFWVDEFGQKWRSLGNAMWLTNLDIDRRHKLLKLTKKFCESNKN